MIVLLSTTHGTGHGAEIVLVELLRAWQARHPPLTVLAPPDSGVATAAGDLGISWVPLPTTRDAVFANLAAAHAATTQLRSARLVHAWTARGLEVSWWIGRRLGVPRTATVHDHPESPVQTGLRRRLWRFAARLQDAVVFPSTALERAWARLTRRSCIIANGLRSVPIQPRRTHGPELVIGFLGMYAPWKGFDIVRAWARAEWSEHVRFVCFGRISPELAGAATALTAELGPRVRFAGEQERERIFEQVDILVQCSTAFDPFPTVLLDAAAAGIPAVASSLGGAAEIVQHGETGFLFDPTDPATGLEHLRRLAADDGLRGQLGRAARDRFERLFGSERMADGYRQFWNAMLTVRR